MTVTKLFRAIAFFSEEVHRRTNGRGTMTLRSADGKVTVKANWIGTPIGGYQGVVRRGITQRPENYKSYVRIGEVGPGKLQLSRGRKRAGVVKPKRCDPT